MPNEEFSFDNIDAFLDPIDKDKNKATMLEKLPITFDHGTPFIDYCDGYVYAIYPNADGSEWTEYSYTREDGNLVKDKRDAENAFHVIKEEIIRGMSEIVEFNVNDVNEIAAKHDGDPKGFIEAIVQKLDPKVPIVRNKDGLQKAIDMVQTS